MQFSSVSKDIIYEARERLAFALVVVNSAGVNEVVKTAICDTRIIRFLLQGGIVTLTGHKTARALIVPTCRF